MGRGHQIAGTQRPSRSLLQDHSGEQQVTNIELFFDLVYVFAVTQLSHHLLAVPTVEGALQTALLLALVWWAWVYTTWATNYLDARRIPVRLMLVVLMLVSLVLSAALPAGAGTGRERRSGPGRHRQRVRPGRSGRTRRWPPRWPEVFN
jgi:low temperature requirement protein LtrA